MARKCPSCQTVKAYKFVPAAYVHRLSKENTATWTTRLQKLHRGYWHCQFCHITKECANGR